MSQVALRHAGGRPTKYKPEIIRKARDYLSNYKDYDDEVPSISGLAIALNIHRDTIHSWLHDDEKKEFSDIITSIMTTQEHALINSGLSSKFNSNITKLLLSKHGYHDNQDKSPSITVNVSRDRVEIETQGQTLTLDSTQEGTDKT